jgi:hypothetical protein
LTLLISLFPLALWYLLWTKPLSISYEVVYYQYHPTCRFSLLYNVFFMLRRLFLTLLSLYLPSCPSAQLQLLLCSNLLILAYLLIYKPFQTPFLNHLELYNEVCILLCSYHLLLFTQLDPVP